MLYGLGTSSPTKAFAAVGVAIGVSAQDPGCRDGAAEFRQRTRFYAGSE
jgi:hypothetical protein